MPVFVIRDLDKQPHSPSFNHPSKSHIPSGQTHLISPVHTPGNSPKMTTVDESSTMTRSASDLSAYSVDSGLDNSHSRTISSVSQGSRAPTQFPFSSIFKWKRAISSSGSTGIPTPPIDESSSRGSGYFSDPGLKGVQITNLDNLGQSIRAQKDALNSTLEFQLQEERRLRHLAEDRLTEVEEEITRLCTVILPTDNGETGEAYFSSILQSVRMAIDSYESRTDGLERQLEEKSTNLITERRERTNVDIECTALRNQLKSVQGELSELQTSSGLREANEALVRENQELRDEVERLKFDAGSVTDLKKKLQAELREAETTKQIAQESSNKVIDRDDSERTALLQRVKDTEAQRDALRQVSRGLRQRLTIETRKNADRTRALAAMDQTISARTQTRSNSRQSSRQSYEGTSPVKASLASDQPQHDRKLSLGQIVQGLGVSGRPRIERYVTALEAPRGRMVVA